MDVECRKFAIRLELECLRVFLLFNDVIVVKSHIDGRCGCLHDVGIHQECMEVNRLIVANYGCFI